MRRKGRSSTVQTIGGVFQYILVAVRVRGELKEEDTVGMGRSFGPLLQKAGAGVSRRRPAALRRAIPIAKPDEWTVPARALWLPFGRAIYNLGELLRRAGRGEAMRVLPAQEDVLREGWLRNIAKPRLGSEAGRFPPRGVYLRDPAAG